MKRISMLAWRVPRRWTTGTAISAAVVLLVAADSIGAVRPTAGVQPLQSSADVFIGSGGVYVAGSSLPLEPASAGDGGARRLRGWSNEAREGSRGRPCTPRRQAIEALGDGESGEDVVSLAEALAAPDAGLPGLGGPVGGPDGTYSFAGLGGGAGPGRATPYPGSPGGPGGGGPLLPGGGELVPPPVPEPSTWALLIVGFGALGAALRRRARRRFA